MVERKQWWTYDKNGPAYCSVVSLEDAIRGHLEEYHNSSLVTGPIVDVRYYYLPPEPDFQVEYFCEHTKNEFQHPRLRN